MRVTISPAAKISGGDVRWQPALDLNRVIVQAVAKRR